MQQGGCTLKYYMQLPLLVHIPSHAFLETERFAKKIDCLNDGSHQSFFLLQHHQSGEFDRDLAVHICVTKAFL